MWYEARTRAMGALLPGLDLPHIDLAKDLVYSEPGGTIKVWH